MKVMIVLRVQKPTQQYTWGKSPAVRATDRSRWGPAARAAEGHRDWRDTSTKLADRWTIFLAFSSRTIWGQQLHKAIWWISGTNKNHTQVGFMTQSVEQREDRTTVQFCVGLWPMPFHSVKEGRDGLHKQPMHHSHQILTTKRVHTVFSSAEELLCWIRCIACT